MTVRVAICGLGRVSSQFVRAVTKGGFSDLFQLVAIHDRAGAGAISTALRHDSTYGPFPGEIVLDGESLQLDDQAITLSSVVEAGSVDWEKSGVDLVILDGAVPIDRELCDSHTSKGARKVLVPHLIAGADITIAIGVNEAAYDPDEHNIIGSAPASMSAAAILIQLLDSNFKIRCGAVTDIAPATATMSLVDRPLAPADGTRGLVNNLAPAPSGSPLDWAPVLGKVSDRLQFWRVTAPVSPVGIVRLAVWLEQRRSIEELLALLRQAASEGELEGLLGIEDLILTAADHRGESRSLVVETASAHMLYDSFVGLTAWYDAEWSAGCRLADLIAIICEVGVPGTA